MQKRKKLPEGPKVTAIVCNVCKADITKRDCKCPKDTAKHWMALTEKDRT